jgi:hypothetical protein
LSAVSPVTLGFVPVPDGDVPPAPFIEVGIETPTGLVTYVWLVDSGANLSFLPADAIEEFGLDREDLTDARITTGANMRAALELPAGAHLWVAVEGLRVPITPYFLLNTDPEGNGEFQDADPILGRDFFLGFAEVAFCQEKRELHLRP